MPGQIYPDKMKMKALYTLTLNVAAGASAVYINTLNLNSIRGQVPNYMDQLYLIYTKYRVFGSALKIEMIGVQSNAESTTNVVELVTYPSSSGSTPLSSATSTDVRRSLPYAKSYLIPAALSTKIPKLTNFIKVTKMDGISKTQLKDDEYAGSLAATPTNPSNLLSWTIAVGNPGGGNYAAFAYRLTLTYYMEVYDRQLTV